VVYLNVRITVAYLDEYSKNNIYRPTMCILFVLIIVHIIVVHCGVYFMILILILCVESIRDVF